MSTSVRPLVFAAAAASGAVIGAAIVIAFAFSHARGPAPKAGTLESPAPVTAEGRLEEELRRRDELISALQARVAEVEGRIGELTVELRAARQPAEEAMEAETEAGERSSAASLKLQGATSWLVRLIPARFTGLTPEEAERLRELDLRDLGITDADLEHLEALSSLRALSLRGTAVTGAGLIHIQGLDRLQTLELRGTKVTGPGLEHLPAGIEALDLTDSLVSQDGLRLLPRLPSLRTLDLNRLALGDAAVEVLARYPSLRQVELDSTAITDDGIRRLLEIKPALERVELRGTMTTAALLRELSEAHPGLTIVRESPPFDR